VSGRRGEARASGSARPSEPKPPEWSVLLDRLDRLERQRTQSDLKREGEGR